MGRKENIRYDKIEQARELLKLSVQRSLIAEELEQLKVSHTGYGGLCSWNDGQFFTPSIVADFMIDIVTLEKKSNVLEFSCGNGIFIDKVLEKNPDINITGIELNIELSRICKLCYPTAQIINDDALDYKEQLKGMYDLVIGNPPFGLRTKKEGYEIAKNKSEEYFIELAISSLKEGGEAILVLPDGIFANSSYKNLRKYIFEKCYYIASFSLPTETFYHSGTGVKTSVMYIKKKYQYIKPANYNVFMAICKEIGWDKRGRSTNRCDLHMLKNAFLKGKDSNFKKFSSLKYA